MFRITAILLLLLGAAAPVHAEDIDDLARLAKTTVVAWSCMMYGPESTDDRLFALGIESGVEFFERVANLTDEERETLSGRIPLLWASAKGPTIDFALGRLFQDTVTHALRDFGTDVEDNRITKALKWEDENCAVLI